MIELNYNCENKTLIINYQVPKLVLISFLMAAKLKRFPLNLVLFGPPGVGKGVYCNLLEKDLGLKAFSTGDAMREMLNKKQHPLFSQQEMIDIEKRVHAGELLNDETVNKIVHPQIIEAKKTGLIFDGYPRTLGQARYLFDQLRIDIVFNLHLREDILIRKLLGRRVCPSCKRSFNVEDVNEGDYVMPPMLPKCDDTTCCDQCVPQTKLITRKDDTREVITKRQ